MCNILNHQRKANEATLRFHVTLVRMAIIQKTNVDKCWLRSRKREPLAIADGGVIWHNPCGN